MSASRRDGRGVVAWFEQHAEHPDLPALVALCDLIEASDDRLVCEIKWNAPSYAITDHFATTGLAPKGGVRLVLHRGAAVRNGTPDLRSGITDATGLLDWRGDDRAIAMFRSAEEVRDSGDALRAILVEWIAGMQE